MGSVILEPGEAWEPLSPTIRVIVSPRHRFNTDTILLAWFSAPRHKDICCDFGTGCGAIPLLWEARYQPRHTYAVELQADAVSMASRSVADNGLADRITVLHRDIRTLANDKTPPFCEGLDLIACNPPYMELGTGLVNPDEGKAIARHECQCTIDDICRSAARALRYGGKFCLCQRPQRLSVILAAMAKTGLEPKRLRLVQQRPDKAPSLFLIEGKKGGSPGMVVEPVLFIEGPDGDFSPEMQKIYGTYKYKD